MDRQFIEQSVDRHAKEIFRVSDAIWEAAELAFTEYRSAELLCEALKANGFTVEKGLAQIETAFKGTFGSGKPVIGFLGEFDALSGLSQEAGALEKRPVTAGGNGHGCGHNLLGTASLLAAIACKEYLEEKKLPGRSLFWMSRRGGWQRKGLYGKGTCL